MSQELIITINADTTLTYSSDVFTRKFKVTGVLGDYEFEMPNTPDSVSLETMITFKRMIFERSGSIFYNPGEHKHLYENNSLCLLHKSFHKTKCTIKQYIEIGLMNYIAGYWNFRNNGHWFNEDKKNNLKDFCHYDNALLESHGLTVKFNKGSLVVKKPNERKAILKRIKEKQRRENEKR